MHRTKKMTVVTTGLALLMAAGMSSAMAANSHGHNDKITICHATHSSSNPYVRINVSENSAKAHGHAQHENDIFLGEDNANTKQCQTTTPPPGDDHHTLTICHYDEAHDVYQKLRAEEGSSEAEAHESHIDDVISRDDNNSKQCPEGDDDDDDNGSQEDPVNCSATSDSTTEQHGLVNVNVDANNGASNVLCQSQILSNVTASVLGTAIGGSGSPVVSTAGENCTAQSTSDTDQVGAVNLNLNADNAASNLLCQSQILSNMNASVLGFSSPFDLLTGVTADVNVLAKVLVLF